MTIVIPSALLADAGARFEAAGAEGREATALVVATSDGVAQRIVMPDQISGVCPNSWVEVTEAGKLELAVATKQGERFAARVHSHPCEAFHSPTDDDNPALTFEGALSIVVPYFGLGLRRGLDACAVYQLRGRRWAALPVGPARDHVVVVR